LAREEKKAKKEQKKRKGKLKMGYYNWPVVSYMGRDY